MGVSMRRSGWRATGGSGRRKCLSLLTCPRCSVPSTPCLQVRSEVKGMD
ncbi:hypothetical protein E2C01_096608 [Portunus trituberculatus]|uniref:Uncharacterized protein n=1 Tax=Portunus trituberculatus TaxID=210409 RepID=A0A5B7K2G8_PORTR|nr:hypothetical protein [Portunus trituberculatus]